MSKGPVDELRLHLTTDASPGVVLEIAKLLNALHATLENPGEFTVTVDNLHAKARLRAWDSASAQQLQVVIATLRDPAAAADKHPLATEIAAAIGKYGAPLQETGAVFLARNGRTPIRRLDAHFVRILRAAGRADVPKPQDTHGRASFRTPVLRVGRTAESAVLQARLMVDGEPVDVDLHSQADVRSMFAAAERGGVHVVDARVAWERRPDGSMHVRPKSIRVLSAVPRPAPLGGSELLERVRISKEAFDTVRSMEEMDD